MNLKIPPVLLTFLIALGMWLIKPFATELEIDSFWVNIFALCLLIIGTVFALSGVLAFRKAKTTVNPVKLDDTNTLVITGVYGISRNPMYFGFALWLLAYAVFCKTPLLLLGAVGFVLYMNKFQIVPEEQFMLEKFGEQYKRYQAKVRRWI